MPTTYRKDISNMLVYVQEGLTGTGAVDDASITALDTTLGVDTLDMSDDRTIIPVGARFTTAGITTIRTVTAQNNSMVWTVTIDATSGNFTLTFEGQTTASILESADASTVQSALEALSNVTAGDLLVSGSAGGPFTITAAGNNANTSGLSLTVNDVDLMGGAGESITTDQDGLSTWEVTFTPALASGSLPTDDDVITWLPRRVEVKIGTGTVGWTETDSPQFDLDRNALDGVRSGPQTPCEVTLSAALQWLRASSGGELTFYEAITQQGDASDWVTTAADGCGPFGVTLIIVDNPTCSTEYAEVITFNQFFKTTINPTINDALISLSGQCNELRPTITRVETWQ